MLVYVPDVLSVQGPRTEDLIIQFYSDVNSAYSALVAGDIDLVAYTGWSAGLPLHDGKQLDVNLYTHAITDPNIVLAPLVGNDIVGFDFNNNYSIATYPGLRSPMTYLSFRQALTLLVDKDFIVNAIKGGFAERIDVPIPYPQAAWWNPNVTGLNYPYPYDPVVAATYLDADGFVQGTTPNPDYDPAFPGSAQYIRTYPVGHSKAGQDLDPLEVCVRTDDAARNSAAWLLINNMRKHGIPVNPTSGNNATLYGKVMGNHDYHIYTSGWVVKKWPIYLYKLYHRDFWYPYGANYVTGLNSTGGSNYPELDKRLEQTWFNDTYVGSFDASRRAQQIMIDECVSVWLYSSKSYVPYRKGLLGLVNMNGYGPVNKYTFLNAFKAVGGVVKVGLASAPTSLNVMYSDWIYDWIGLDRIYGHLMNEAPYDLSVDQPWVAQDWYVDTWVDPQDGKTKTRVTYWLRENVSWVEPVTGSWDGQLTAHDVEFSIWYNYAHNDAWHYNDVADVHHTRIVDNSSIEVYFDVLTYWGVYWIGEQLPLIPKHLWLQNFCEARNIIVTLDRDYVPCEKFMLTEDAVVQTVAVELDGTPLVESVDYNVVAKNGCHNWIHWLIPAYTGQNLTAWYWTPIIDPHGFTPGNYPWDDKLEGCGMYYATAFTPGVGGSLTLKRNPHFWLETPILGDIDFLWYWDGYDQSRRIDANRAPRHGCYRVDLPDVSIANGAYGSQGTGIPDPNWFPGADLSPPGGLIDTSDIATVTTNINQRWGCTAPYLPPPPQMFWKANFTDYAPSGIPDFDQRQDSWWPPWDPSFNWSWCAPTAVANSIWWYDSKYESNTIPPPAIIDNYPLVSNYGPWDDHDPQNVQPFIEHLAYLMDTDSQRTGTQLQPYGTKVIDMETGLAHYLSWTGLNPQGDLNGDGVVNQTDVAIVNTAMGSNVSMPNWNMAADIFPVTTGWPSRNMADNVVDSNDLNLVTANMNKKGAFYERTVPMPDFSFIEEEVERSEDVVLSLGFYYKLPDGSYNRVIEVTLDGNEYHFPHGHAVTVAGVNSTTMQVAISDPVIDAFERGLTLGRSPVPHTHPGTPTEPPYTLHNNASLVSHDIYNVAYIPNMTMWELVGYPAQGVHALIENAVITSPLENHDVSVTNLTLGKTVVGEDYPVDINVTVANEGAFTETFNVTIYHHNHDGAVFSEDFESGTFSGWDFHYSTNGAQSGSIPPGTWSSDIVTGGSALSGTYSARLFADSDISVSPYWVDAAINRTINRSGALLLRATLKFDDIQGTGGTGISYFAIDVFNALDTSKRVFYGFCTTGNYGDIRYTVNPSESVNFKRNIVTDYSNKYNESLPDQIMIRFLSHADYAETNPPGQRRRTTNVTIDDILIVGPPVPIQTKTVALTPGNSTVITFTWNTTGVAKGNYTISASAWPVPGETDTIDNSMVGGWVFVTLPGDVDGDRDVDIYDIVAMAVSYNTHEGEPGYEANYDIDGDGDIDIYDIVAAARNYNKSW